MPFLLASLAVVALGYTTKQVAVAADTSGNAALKLAAAGVMIGGTYYLVRRVS